MYQIERPTFVEVRPTSWELANVFCDMDADEQAEFFNFIEQITNTWESHLCIQLQNVTDSRKLTNGGRIVMGYIGEYSEKQTD